jgi:sigma-B regulation protein RsbU (phosphoserine phosphatase)
VAGSDGMVLNANATLCRWLGYGPQELEGRVRFPDLLTVGGRIFHQTHLAPLLRMQGSVAEVKLELRHKAGHVVPMMLNAVEKRLGDDLVLHAALFVTEERHKYERELLLQRKRAEEMAQFAEQMMGIVSHDLRNPLNVIVMSTFVLERADLSPTQRTVLSRIDQSARHAQRLINDLLDFTQAQLGKGLSLHPGTIALHDVVGEAVAALRVAYAQRQIDHLREGEGRCRADADRVSQAIGNLVSNAVAYGAPGQPITVRSSVTAGGCEISVRNAGTPIPQETQAKLFEPMVRGDHRTQRGVGLGLYIVREIARGHGGTVAVSSTQQGGTTFTLHLPAEQAA